LLSSVAQALDLVPQATADFEARTLTPREIDNAAATTRLLALVRFFDPSTQATGVKAWDHFAVHAIESALPAANAEELATILGQTFAPVSPLLEVWAGPIDAAPETPPLAEIPDGARTVRYWEHLGIGSLRSVVEHNVYASSLKSVRLSGDALPFGFDERLHVTDLGAGVSCRLSLWVYRTWTSTIPSGSTPQEWKDADKPALSMSSLATRLADVALIWGVMEHFYPYFDVVDTDWNAALPAALAEAAASVDAHAHLRTLRRLSNRLHDGHAFVNHPNIPVAGCLPLGFDWTGPNLMVMNVSDIESTLPIRPGDIVLAVNGSPIDEVYTELRGLVSAATEGYGRHFAALLLSMRQSPDPVSMDFERPDGERYSATVPLVPTLNRITIPPTPDNGSQVAPGVVYFNLVGTERDEFKRHLQTLVDAKAIVFDVRGYPAGAAFELLPHLSDQNIASARWNIPRITRPQRQGWQWRETAWDLAPAEPHLRQPMAFLTSAAAVSYGESIMGIVEHYKFGEIVGSTTAGTNGNVNPFLLPSGAQMSWTGMRVLKHDGSTHHGVGIQPTLPVIATPAGVAAGRDEVLERAVELLLDRLKQPTPE
jgi:C-terminal processing protease CtpA/Prc